MIFHRYHKWDNTTASRKRTKTKRYNEESWQAGRHTPNTGISSKATLPSAWKDKCTTPECAASYDIWCRDLDTDQTSTEQTCGRTDQNGKKYAQHHIQKIEGATSGLGRRTKLIDIIYTVRNEMGLGRAYQPPQRRPMDLARHHLETIWQEKTSRETSQAVERRPGQILERHDMAEDSTRQGHLETTCWGLRPTHGTQRAA